MACAYVCFVQHDRPDLAQQLLSNPLYSQHPSQISNLMSQVELSLHWILNIKRIYSDILTYLLQHPSNAFKEQFQKTVQKFQASGFNFVVASSSHEMVLSCGLSFGTIEYPDDWPGLNAYGTLLNELADKFLHGNLSYFWTVSDLLSEKRFFNGSSYNKTVLLIIDSQGSNVKSIQGGDIMAISGGTSRHMVNFLCSGGLCMADPQQKPPDLSQYRYIVVCTGINDVGKDNDYDPMTCYYYVDRLLDILVQESKRTAQFRVLFSPSYLHKKPELFCLRDFSRYAAYCLKDTAVQCVNWMERPDLVKFIQDRDAKRSIIENDGRNLHFNHAGFNCMWKIWCTYLPRMKYVNYRLGRYRLAKRKHDFNF